MRSVYNYLDFLNEFPLSEEIRYFEKKSKDILLVVTNKDKYEYSCSNMQKLIFDLVTKTEYNVF